MFVCVADILLLDIICYTTGDHMHPVRAYADEAMEGREPRRTTTVGRESKGQEARNPDGCGRSRHIRFLLVSHTGE